MANRLRPEHEMKILRVEHSNPQRTMKDEVDDDAPEKAVQEG
jgi:hypothetical protein